MNRLFSSLALAACTVIGPTTAAFADDYQTIFQAVDQTRLLGVLKDMSGSNSVTVNGETFTISERYTPASKANFRKYWTAYFQALGMQVNTLAYDTQYNIESQGHNVEAILPGKSADSIVIIVHYDSIGPHGSDTPGVDDDMTGMSTMLETARLLKPLQSRLQHTVRFVAADYEEWGDLEGSRNYAQYIKNLSQQQGFKIVSAVDDEQSGWKQGDDTFDVFDCGGATDSTTLGKQLIQTASQYSQIATTEGCMGDNSDHYAMWEIGVQAVVFSEHNPFQNDHFDAEGGDTFDKIDQNYFFQIAQVGVTFASEMVGIAPAGKSPLATPLASIFPGGNL